jgi:hypothetical protein
MRKVVAISLLCCFVGCDGESRATTAPPATTATPVAVVLQRSAGLPRFEIQATFEGRGGVDLDPAPHIQPIASALAAARAVCARGDLRPALAAVLDVDIRDKQVHASSRNSTGVCLARELDGKPIEDATSFHVELLVSAG